MNIDVMFHKTTDPFTKRWSYAGSRTRCINESLLAASGDHGKWFMNRHDITGFIMSKARGSALGKSFRCYVAGDCGTDHCPADVAWRGRFIAVIGVRRTTESLVNAPLEEYHLGHRSSPRGCRRHLPPQGILQNASVAKQVVWTTFDRFGRGDVEVTSR